jgi:pimeloyl-ACP methyl ester carboxylesterase
MQHFDSGGVDIAYLDAGEGDPVLLIHGFGTNVDFNWVQPGWVDDLTASGRRVIASDDRGHGGSAKLYDPEGYRMQHLAKDAARLLDHLGIERADVLGYSMGARVAAMLAIARPQRTRSLVLGGMGRSLVEGLPPAHDVADALEAESLDDVTDEKGRLFRQFAERTGGDRKALAACMRCAREGVDAAKLAALPMPVLLARGTADTIAEPLAVLAGYLPAAERFDIVDRDHMRAVGDLTFRARVLAFLAARP